MTIYVSNIGFHVESNDLKNLFAVYGEVETAKVVADKATNRSRGFGFVEMQDEAAANEAIAKLNGHVVEGRALRVNMSKPKEKSYL